MIVDLSLVLVGHLLKTRKNTIFKETEDSRYIYRNELDKACFQGFKDLLRKTVSDNVLRDKAFNIAKNPKTDRYQRGLTSIDDKFFHEKSFGRVFTRASSP